MQIAPETLVAQIATDYPAAIRVFQRHGIDFCCGGKRPLSVACREHGIEYEALANDLIAALAPAAASNRSWSQAPLAELIAHIVIRHHTFLREELPRLGHMAEKVHRVHSERHPEMLETVAQTFATLRSELETHIEKEEGTVFPWVLGLERSAVTKGSGATAASASLAEPLADLEDEHLLAGAALATLRKATSDYQPPEGACNTFRGLFHGLAELEADLHQHIHLENNVLFPRARALAAALRS